MTGLLPGWTPALWAACTALGFFRGAWLFFRRGNALFAQLVVCALGCLWLGRLFPAVWQLVRGAAPEGFHIGFFGTLGGFLFLFSANFDQMDHLVDGGEAEFYPWRLAALAAPAAMAAVGAWIVLLPCDAWRRGSALLVLAPVVPASYYACKHLILPDEAMWLLEAMRPCQLCVLGLCVAQALELAAGCQSLTALGAGAAAVQSALCLLIPDVLSRGIQKWKR